MDAKMNPNPHLSDLKPMGDPKPKLPSLNKNPSTKNHSPSNIEKLNPPINLPAHTSISKFRKPIPRQVSAVTHEA
jgi:hypothetical protein